MKLIVIAVGNKMPDWVTRAWDDYAKRMPPDCAIELR
ncbi:MAG: 23S rRNA (pseudouridine(1915)-N(3))-methyltransferase RlmH, partial [Achromobacter sp.]